LWRFKDKGGFEAAFEDQIQVARVFSAATSDPTQRLEAAIHDMFGAMDKGFAEFTNFNSINDVATSVTAFLAKFDAIFTLNQDLLMERQYLTDNLALLLQPKRTGWQIPGMEQASVAPFFPTIGALGVPVMSPMDDPSKFVVDSNLQPFFKLHGSSNWIDYGIIWPVLVIGGNKPQAIEGHPILKWNYEQFKSYLSKADTRLMVIGYSFGDEHINVAIRDAAEKGSLKLFIIDPSGVDVLTKNRLAPPGYMFEKLQPHLIGASRRVLRETFGGDRVEHGKVMRFFD
jgi:hypothetical protein